MNKSENITELAKALALAQSKMPVVPMDATNPYLKNRYATLGAIIESSRAVLGEHGLAVTQLPINDGAMVGVETILTHESGQWLSQQYCIPIGDAKGMSMAQQAGSVLTYLSRYALRGVLKIYADEDNDGNHPTGTTVNKALVINKPVLAPVGPAAPTKATPPPAATDTKELLPGVKSIIGTFNKVFTKEGTSSRGAWVKASVRLGDVWYSTFDERLRGKLDELKDLPTEIRYMTDSKGFHSVVELLPAEAAPTPEPQDDDIPF